ncbi:hypothetical protein [Enterococcus faecalis]|uniref:hypothetical protein n=2 Tax=Bacillati TaxID=1783272 RepID=UPI00293672A0|nr:hypothetical protein [Enterococcus faecalis]MDV2540884.1 hypothetical protein [Enterococcus faecalis]MDV2553932.1 hypothetical protein [Enterococcus faecalis]
MEKDIIPYDEKYLKEVYRLENLPHWTAVEKLKEMSMDHETAMYPVVRESADYNGWLEYSYTVVIYERLIRPGEIRGEYK